MNCHYTPTLFTRHNRPLHTLWLESQAWFCAHELGRLTGRYFNEHCIRKLDPDQHRSLRILRHGRNTETVMISESGAYTLLAHHYIPENRHLRQWLTHEVVPMLRDSQVSEVTDMPRLGRMLWPGGHTASLLYWRSEAWVRLRDMPVVMAAEGPVDLPDKRRSGWQGYARHVLGLR